MLIHTHPNEEIGWLIEGNPEFYKRFKIVVANRAARTSGRRCVGPKQISFCYGLDSILTPRTPEEFEAIRVLDELGEDCDDQDALIIDLHSNDLGITFVESGAATTKRAIVFASMCGVYDFIVAPYSSFYDRVVSGIAFEASHPYEFIDEIVGPGCILDGFTALSIKDINLRYESVIKKMRFWQSFEILAALAEGSDCYLTTVGEATALRELERIPAGRPFTPIPDNAVDALQAFGIKSRMGRPHFLTWGYQNESAAYPDLLGRTADGRVRKLCFGCVVMPIEQPHANDKYSGEQQVFFADIFE